MQGGTEQEWYLLDRTYVLTMAKPNPFTAKAKKTNPFTAKAKKTVVTPAAKRNGNNPFAARAMTSKSQRIAELDGMIIEAEQRYEQSLNKALKGITREQTQKRFNVSDNYMRTLMNLTAARKRIIEGKEVKPKKQRKRKQTVKPPPPRKPKPKPVAVKTKAKQPQRPVLHLKRKK